MPTQPTVLQGTLDLMILAVLQREALHGYALARRIERLSGQVLAVEEGSLYPALHRLSKRGELAAEWRTSHTGRRARYYRVTPDGKRALAQQEDLWRRLSGAVSQVIDPAPGAGDVAHGVA